MAKRLCINASEEQITNLKAALSYGTPITLALEVASISAATFYYWVAIASIVVYCKEQEELEQIESIAQSGVSLQECKDLAASMSPKKKMAIGYYVEPKPESILQYKNSRKFRKFANEVYEIISDCNRIRSQVVMKHLDNIKKSVNDKRISASGSMWFLERTQSDYFGRAIDKAKIEENAPGVIDSIKVEFVDPQTSDSKARLEEMERLVISELKGSGDA